MCTWALPKCWRIWTIEGNMIIYEDLCIRSHLSCLFYICFLIFLSCKKYQSLGHYKWGCNSQFYSLFSSGKCNMLIVKALTLFVVSLTPCETATSLWKSIIEFRETKHNTITFFLSVDLICTAVDHLNVVYFCFDEIWGIHNKIKKINRIIHYLTELYITLQLHLFFFTFPP